MQGTFRSGVLYPRCALNLLKSRCRLDLAAQKLERGTLGTLPSVTQDVSLRFRVLYKSLLGYCNRLLKEISQESQDCA